MREINEEKCEQQPEAFVGNETLLFSLNSTPYPTPDIWKEWLIMFTASRKSQIPDCMAPDRQRQKQGFGSDGKTDSGMKSSIPMQEMSLGGKE